MMKGKSLTILCLTGAMLLAHASSVAEIYKIINPDGSITFSDQPSEGASTVPEAPKPQASEPAPVTPAKKPTTTATTPDKKPETSENKPTVYKSLTIASPKNDEAVRSNEGAVTVAVSLTPLLDTNQGDTITLFLDGQPVGKPSNLTVFNLADVTRGSHTLSATLKNKNGATLLVSPTITFHLLKAQAR